MARLVEAAYGCADFAGGGGIRLAFEPEPGMFIDTMDKSRRAARKVNPPELRPDSDVGHLVCNGRAADRRPHPPVAGLAVERPHRGHAAGRPRPPDVRPARGGLRRSRSFSAWEIGHQVHGVDLDMTSAQP